MQLNEYQNLSKRTLPEGNLVDKLANYGMGLAGEAAEVTDELKKAVFHGHALDKDKIKKELGDTMHYVSGIASFLGIDLNDIAQANINKLKERYPKGFSEEASKNRKEYAND